MADGGDIPTALSKVMGNSMSVSQGRRHNLEKFPK